MLNGVNPVRRDHTHSNDSPSVTYKNLYKKLALIRYPMYIRTASVICRFLYGDFTADLHIAPLLKTFKQGRGGGFPFGFWDKCCFESVLVVF